MSRHEPPKLERSSLAGRYSAHSPDRKYDRRRDLPALIAVWPTEIDHPNDGGHLVLLSKLRRALRLERRRGLAGHWTYDLARHAQLLIAYRHELAAAGRAQSSHGGRCNDDAA